MPEDNPTPEELNEAARQSVREFGTVTLIPDCDELMMRFWVGSDRIESVIVRIDLED